MVHSSQSKNIRTFAKIVQLDAMVIKLAKAVLMIVCYLVIGSCCDCCPQTHMTCNRCLLLNTEIITYKSRSCPRLFSHVLSLSSGKLYVIYYIHVSIIVSGVMGREVLKGHMLSCQQIRQDNCSEEVAIRSIADMCNVFL